MFDNHHLHLHDSSGPSHVTVTKTEKRAPTDESVRLLREMEQKAKDQVLQSVRLENTLVDGVLHFQLDFLSHDRRLACVFEVNGKRMQAHYTAKAFDDVSDMAIGIRDAIAKVIANELTDAVIASSKEFRQELRFSAA